MQRHLRKKIQTVTNLTYAIDTVSIEKDKKGVCCSRNCTEETKKKSTCVQSVIASTPDSVIVGQNYKGLTSAPLLEIIH